MIITAILYGFKYDDKLKIINNIVDHHFIDFEINPNSKIDENSLDNLIIFGNPLNFNYDTKYKYYTEYNNNIYEEQLIESRLKTFKLDICKGNYNLSNIDLNTVIKYNKKNLNKLKVNKYKKTDVNIIIKKLLPKVDVIYIGSKKNYDEIIPIEKIKERFDKLELKDLIRNIPIYGFNDKWLAVLSSCQNNKIKKGVIDENNNQYYFIEETEEKGLKCLNTECYLYTVKVEQPKRNGYKYILDSDATILHKFKIDSVKEYLKNEGIKLIKFNEGSV